MIIYTGKKDTLLYSRFQSSSGYPATNRTAYSMIATRSERPLFQTFKMKLLILTPYLASLVAAETSSYDSPKVGNRVSYKDDKAIRLRVGDNVSKVKRMIRDLSLSTWNGAPEANEYVDIVVPQSKFAAFMTSTESMDTEIMHEDLGASIEKEAKYGAYSGIFNYLTPW